MPWKDINFQAISWRQVPPTAPAAPPMLIMNIAAPSTWATVMLRQGMLPYGGFQSHGGTPKSSKSLDHFSIETHSFGITPMCLCLFLKLFRIPTWVKHVFFPQQRKLMGSSAQNSSGVRWCRRRVRFNEVREKVPKVPEKVWEALVQSQVRFNRVPEKVREKVPEKVPGGFGEKVWGALVQSHITFNRVPEKVLEKVWEALVQSQVRFNRGSMKVPEKVPEKVWEALVQSQVRFNRICGHLTYGNV